MKKQTHILLMTTITTTLTATGTVTRLRGEGGAGDSCTLDGVTKTASDGSKFAGCEQPP